MLQKPVPPQITQERNPSVPELLNHISNLCPPKGSASPHLAPQLSAASVPLPSPAVPGLPGSPSLLPDVGAVGVTPDKRYGKQLVSGGPWGPRAGAREGLSHSLPSLWPPSHSPRAPRSPALGTPPVPRGCPGSVAPSTPHLAVFTPLQRGRRPGRRGGHGAAWVGGGAGIIAMAGGSSATLPTLRSQSRRASPSPWGALGPAAWLLPLASGTPGGVGPRLEWSGAASAVGTSCQHPETTTLGLPGPSLVNSPQCTGRGNG